MLKASWIPTPLIPAAARSPVPILPVSRPPRFRVVYVAGRLAALAASLLVLRLTPGYDPDRLARRVREVCETLGGLWIKAGQIIALRIDLLPAALCRELSKLQSRALGFPPEVARAIVEQDLGAPLESVFDEWEGLPFAAASIGQVHRARLRHEGVWVAVKVQKPHSKALFASDLMVIEGLVSLVRLLRFYPHMKWQDGLHELRQIMREELDFSFEAGSTRRMKRILRTHKVYAPRVFARYSSPRVLVTEFVDMVLMADYLRVAQEDPDRLQQWREENGVVPSRVARRLIRSFQRQLMDDNLFHGDLHPGNIGLLRGGRVVLIDFGATSFTEGDYLWKFRTLMRTLATGEFAKSADMCLMLCANLPPIDLGLVHGRLVHVIRAWAAGTWVKQLPYHDKSVGRLTLDVMQVLLGYRCTMEWSWLRLHRASATLDASLIELAPGIDYRKLTARTFAAIERRRLQRAVGAMGVRRTMAAVQEALERPARLRDYVAAQEALIRRQVQVFRGLADTTGTAISTVVGLGRLAVLVQAGVAIAVVVSASGSAMISAWLTRWLGGVTLEATSADPRPLLAVLLLDVWLWCALVRIGRAVGGDRAYHHRQAVTA